MATTATAVSAVLRRGGLLPVPRSREGIHVTSGGRGKVAVTVDVDSSRREREMTEDAVEILTAKGYTVTRREPTPHILTVTKGS